MQIELFTDKTVAQCMNALTDRMEAKGTATRPAIDGWIEKGGKFSLAITTVVGKRFQRTTRLHGTTERENGVTLIRASVSTGASREQVIAILGILLIVAVLLTLRNNALLGVVAMLVGGALYVPLIGDHRNSIVLQKELRNTLKAKDKPPRTARKK